MKTDDLITALAADAGPPEAPMPRRLGVGIAAGAVAATMVFVPLLGVRADIAAALATWRFDLKLLLVAAALVAALVDCVRLVRPTETKGLHWSSVAAGVLVLAAVVLELVATPADGWWAKLVGTNAWLCLTAIPLLAVAPLVVLLLVMRGGAPRSPQLAGAAAGRLAAAIGALFYATHCFDDSPLFVVTWYGLAMLVATVIGAAAGARVLRW